MANRSLDRVLAPEFLDGIDEWPIEEIRSRRAECQCLEDAASYLRRLVQTRIDILSLASNRRANGQPADVNSIVENLKGVLSDDRGAHGANGRLVTAQPREDQESWAQRRIHDVAQGHDVEASLDLDDDALAAMTDRFIGLEGQISKERRALHDVYDRIQAELIDRYKSGRASVDSLLVK